MFKQLLATARAHVGYEEGIQFHHWFYAKFDEEQMKECYQKQEETVQEFIVDRMPFLELDHAEWKAYLKNLRDKRLSK